LSKGYMFTGPQESMDKLMQNEIVFWCVPLLQVILAVAVFLYEYLEDKYPRVNEV